MSHSDPASGTDTLDYGEIDAGIDADISPARQAELRAIVAAAAAHPRPAPRTRRRPAFVAPATPFDPTDPAHDDSAEACGITPERRAALRDLCAAAAARAAAHAAERDAARRPRPPAPRPQRATPHPDSRTLADLLAHLHVDAEAAQAQPPARPTRRRLEPRAKRALIRAARELPTPGEPPRLTPPRAWRPMNGAEWEAIRPFVDRQGPGRPIQDPRTRLDLVFGVAVAGLPWEVGHDFAAGAAGHDFAAGAAGHGLAAGGPAVRGNTLGRQFRRWTHAGVWRTLLLALVRTDCDPALRAMEYWILRAARRAMRLMGLAGLALARLLGQLTALPLPPALLPNPYLSESTDAAQAALYARGWRLTQEPLHRLLEAIRGAAWRRRPWSRALAPA